MDGYYKQNYNKMLNILLVSVFILTANSADWTKVDDLFRQAIYDRAMPGAILTVANATHTIYRKSYGKLTYNNQIHDVEVNNNTKYDIASITKVMAATYSIMQLMSSNSIKLTDPITKFYSNYDVNKKGNTTIANLLLHNSGQKYDYPGALPKTTDEVINYIVFAKPDNPVGTAFQYSNLGFLLLSLIVSKVRGVSFEQYVKQNNIFAGLTNTGFNPPQSQWYNIAPCQYDSDRKRIVRGEAHQRLAYFFGGVGGHSGLFTTADDITRFMRILLNKGKLPNEPSRIISEAIVDLFTTKVEGLPYPNTYSYGFDTRCPSSRMSNCFGHGGSTGPIAVADKDKKIIITILTNRGHPDVKNNKIDAYKSKIADAIMQALGY